MESKNIFAENLQKYMKENGVSRRDLSEALGISYYTVTSWVNGSKYPRMDKVEMMADYFGILKSDLIEDKSVEEKKQKTDVAVDIVFRLNSDQQFLEAVKLLNELSSEQLEGVNAMLRTLFK